MFSLSLTLAALDNLFNLLLLFRVGIFVYCVSCKASPYITHSWSAIPGRPQAPPAVLSIPGRPQASPAFTCGPPHYLSSCAQPSFLIPAVCIPPRGPCLHPTVLAYALPSFDTPYSPPQNPGRPSVSPGVPLSSRYRVCFTIWCRSSKTYTCEGFKM